MKISLLNFMINFNDSSTVEICANSFSGYNAYSRLSYHCKLPNSSGSFGRVS